MNWGIFGLVIAAIAGGVTAFMRQYRIGPWLDENTVTMDYTEDTVASLDRTGQDVPVVPSSVPAPQAPTALPSPFKPMILKWAALVTQGEGANPLSNNPGNLKYSTLTASWGATKGHPASDGGFLCQFKTPQAGKDALCNFLTLGAEYELIISHPKPCSIHDFTVRFAGNPPEGYIDRIVQGLGVVPTTDIAMLLS